MSTKVQHSTLQNNSRKNENVLGDLNKVFSKRERPVGIENIISTDTLKMRLPLSTVSIKDEIIHSRELTVNSVTGEITKEKVSTIEKDNTYYRIESFNVNGRTPERFIVIAMGAKLLKERYLEGITYDNKDLVYNAIKSHGIIDFSMDTFMDKSACTDIDFKIDGFYHGDPKKLINNLYARSKPKKQQGYGCRKFTRKDNMGIQWSTRETTSIASNPFLKMYAKQVELIHKHADFHSKFLSEYDLNGLLRLEATLKNQKHFMRLFNHKCTNLWAVLSMPQEDKQLVFDHAIKCHLKPRTTKREKEKSILKGRNIGLYSLVAEMLSIGYSIELIEGIFLQDIDSKKQRWRMRKDLYKFHQIFISENGDELYWIEDIFWTKKKVA